MGAPENVSSVSSDTLIEWVSRLGLSERWVPGHHNEKNDGGGKNIHLLALVRRSQMDLRSHVVKSSEFSVQVSLTVPTFGWAGEAKVSNLQIIVLVQEEVLRFQISVRDLLVVAEVEAVHELFEVETCLGLRE